MPIDQSNGDLILSGDVGGSFWMSEEWFTAAEVRAALPAGDVTIRLNSGGGIASEGAAIHSVLKAHSGKVMVIVEGMAASAASLLAMAADEVVMADGAFMMIHDPSAMTIGTEADHVKSAKTLGMMADEYARIYADRAVMNVDQAREIMKEETWFTPESAVSAGFADRVEGEMTAVAKFPYQIYAKAPDALLAKNSAPIQGSMDRAVAMAAFTGRTGPSKEMSKMADPKEVSEAPVVATPADDKQTMKTPETPKVVHATSDEIIEMSERAKLSLKDVATLLKTPLTSDQVKARIYDMRIDAADQGPEIINARASVERDGLDKFKEGATLSLMAKAGIKDGERNQFSSMSLRELARESLSMRGLKPTGTSAMDMVSNAFVPTMAGGMHGNSDFGDILADVANKAMMGGFNEAEETFQMWTTAGTASDFKPSNRINLDAFPSLPEVPEHGEYTYGTMGDHKETIVVATYGKLFAITRQAVINDDLSAFTRIPNKMGRAAIRTVGDLVYAILNGNPNMADGTALFHADHNNLAGSGAAPSVISMNAAYEAMMAQTDRSGNATALNITPAYGLFPVALRSAALQVLESEHDPAKTSRSANTARNIVEPIIDNRLTGTAWYMAANPSVHDTIEVAYLDGQQAPFLDQQDGWSVDGTEFKVRIDAGVKALAWEGLYKDPGA